MYVLTVESNDDPDDEGTKLTGEKSRIYLLSASNGVDRRQCILQWDCKAVKSLCTLYLPAKPSTLSNVIFAKGSNVTDLKAALILYNSHYIISN